MRIKVKLLLSLSVISALTVGSLSGQAVLYYDVTWSGVGASASARVAIDTSVGSPAYATDGTLHQYTSSEDYSALWIQFSDFSITAGGTTVLPDQGDLTALNWQSGSPINPTVFNFNGDNSTLGSTPWQITGSANTGFQLVLNPSGSATSYNMTQTSFSAVPEPEEWAAIASTGLLAFGIWHRRSRKAKKA
jgi:hypothetical protein